MTPAPATQVDLDLDALAPPTHTFKLRGQEYELLSELPIPTLVEAMKHQRAMEEVAEMMTVSDDDEDLAAVGARMSEITTGLHALIESVTTQNGKPATLPVMNSREMFGIVGLLMTGKPIQMNDAVLEALRIQPNEEGGTDKLPPTRTTARRKNGTAARKQAGRSTKPSRARSSG